MLASQGDQCVRQCTQAKVVEVAQQGLCQARVTHVLKHFGSCTTVVLQAQYTREARLM